jgi:hypothetical protein
MSEPGGLVGPWLLVALACRNHDFEKDEPEDTGRFDCLPYELECSTCTLESTLALPDLLRHWRCEDPDLGELVAVLHRSDALDADDEHYYDADGQRVAARRLHDQPVPVCSEATPGTEEWWGAILDCAALCEVDPSLPLADPSLPPC